MNNGVNSSFNSNPLVTFALFTYNQEDYVREAVESALAQDYCPLEILISDDCSTDKTVDIIKSIIIYSCSRHIIRLNVNKSNIGLANHVNKIFEMASGDLIVAAAGDDISMPHRVTRLVDVFTLNNAMLIHSSAISIDIAGVQIGVVSPDIGIRSISPFDAARSLSFYIGATGAWSRLLYTKYGAIVCPHSYEDLVFGFRAVLETSIEYINEPLVKYRIGSGITTKNPSSKTKFFNECAQRLRTLHVIADVYSQRLLDLNVVRTRSDFFVMSSYLEKEITIHKNMILFHQNPLRLIFNLFSKDFNLIFKSIACEFNFFIKLILKSIIQFIKN